MKKIISLTTSLLFLTICAFAQFPTLDPTWNSIGKVNTTDTVNFYSSVITPTGKVIACGGTTKNNKQYYYIAKYNANGTHDNSFGTNGVVMVDFGFINQGAKKIIIDNSNRLIIGGNLNNGTEPTNEMGICVLNINNGLLDNSFAANGKIALNPTTQGEYFGGMGIDTTNNLYIGGTSTNAWYSNSGSMIVLKLSSNGIQDNSFATNGLLNFTINSGDNRIHSLLIDKTKIVGLGYTGTVSCIFRLNLNGSFDNSFNSNGKLVITSSTNDQPNAFIKGLDGNYYTVGQAWSNIWNAYVVAINSTNGSLLTSFGTNGRATYTQGLCVAISQDKNGKFLLGLNQGSGRTVGTQLIRVNSNGSLDNTFGTSGVFIYEQGLTSTLIWDIKIDACNNILTNGSLLPFASIYRFNTATSTCNCYAMVYDTIRAKTGLDTLKIASITGINTLPSNFGTVKIYPNPTNNLLNITVSNPSSSYKINILNSLSQSVYSTIITNSSYQIDMSSYTRGMYFIQITDLSSNVLETKKLILE